MMVQLSAWWRARTDRERLLVQIAAVLLFAIVVPAWTYTSAAQFRRDAANELASARQLSSQVSQLKEAMAADSASANPRPTGPLRDRALALAEAGGLQIANVQASGPGRVRIAFAAGDSVAVYRWIEAVGRAGASVDSTSIVRVGEGNEVSAEFELSDAS